MTLTLSNLFPNLPSHQAKLEVTGISCDSLNIQSGDIFFALQGNNLNGNKFVLDAISKGAIAVVTDTEPSMELLSSSVCYIKVSDARKILGSTTAQFYPNQPENIAAVTGTNGKSSVVHFCREIWQKLRIKAASMGTLGIMGDVDLSNFSLNSSLTTPDVIFIHKLLNEVTKQGVSHLALEASSHGIMQHRLDHIKIKSAAFTSFSRDHLDYHLTLENYLQTKARLFTELMTPHHYAILNSDIAEFDYLKDIAKRANHHIIDYGKSAKVIKLLSLDSSVNKQLFSFSYNNQTYQITTSLIGEFQVYNLLCALGLVISLGSDPEEVINTLSDIRAVPGRMERVEIPNNLNQTIIVDYAHTPDALLNALKELRPLCQGTLKLLFGCGGNRDQGKRAEMGKIAASYADYTIVTDDNPRFEQASQIRKQIISSCPQAIEIPNREQAIEYAIKNMEANDILLIAGKGHEKTQIIEDQHIECDDVKLAQNFAKQYL